MYSPLVMQTNARDASGKDGGQKREIIKTAKEIVNTEKMS